MKYSILSLIFILAGAAQAEEIYCQGQVDFYGEVQKFHVLIEGDGIGQAYTPSKVMKIEVSGASLPQTNVITEAVDYWDGHSAGMITAKGFSMTYEKIHGCIKNVVISTDFRGDIKKMGETVGHITQSQVIPLCKNSTPFCSAE